MTQAKDVEPVSVLLNDVGSKGVWIEEHEDNVMIKSYVSALEDVKEYLVQIQNELQALEQRNPEIGPISIEVHEVDEESWADEWKKYYEPTRITETFTIKPVWREYIESTGEKIIHLDPGMAFGTGTHPSTILAVRLLEKHLLLHTQVLDVGCGSGILSVVAAKLGAEKVQAIDIDPVALEKTRENVLYNQVEEQVGVKQGDLLNGIREHYDVVIANILAEVIIDMASDLSTVLKPDGVFICSGIIQEKEEQVREALYSYQLLDKITRESWVAMVFKRC